MCLLCVFSVLIMCDVQCDLLEGERIFAFPEESCDMTVYNKDDVIPEGVKYFSIDNDTCYAGPLANEVRCCLFV